MQTTTQSGECPRGSGQGEGPSQGVHGKHFFLGFDSKEGTPFQKKLKNRFRIRNHNTSTEFPIPLFMIFRYVLFWEFPCPAWAVASFSSGPQAGGNSLKLSQKISMNDGMRNSVLLVWAGGQLVYQISPPVRVFNETF